MNLVWFTGEQSAAAAAIHQLINAWAATLDRSNGLDLGPLIAEECVYIVRGIPRRSRDDVLKFYCDRLAELERTPAGPPTQRHVISNLLLDFTADGKVGVDFLLTYYMSPKKPPVMDMQGPTAVADCHMDCSRAEDGHWRIASFDSVQSFVRGPA